MAWVASVVSPDPIPVVRYPVTVADGPMLIMFAVMVTFVAENVVVNDCATISLPASDGDEIQALAPVPFPVKEMITAP